MSSESNVFDLSEAECAPLHRQYSANMKIHDDSIRDSIKKHFNGCCNALPLHCSLVKIESSSSTEIMLRVYFYPSQLLLFLCAQVELENWVNSIHSACAAAFARHRGKTGTLHLLQEEIFRLDKAIESVRKAPPLPGGK